MANSITINSPVDVTAIGFGRDLRSYPRRIEFEGAREDAQTREEVTLVGGEESETPVERGAQGLLAFGRVGAAVDE